MNTSHIGIIGIGVMGSNLALNMAQNGFTVSVYNRSDSGEENVVKNFLQTNSNFINMQGFTELSAFIASLEKPRRIFLMVKAGAVIDVVLAQLHPFLAAGDVVMDGGNSHYQDTNRRQTNLQKSGIHFLGIGVSGGAKGARFGPAIMPSGSASAYDLVAPILEKIAAKDANNTPCCGYIGSGGSGHFVKMVHNGIEYAEMQLLAELYALLSIKLSNEVIADMWQKWQEEETLSSYLLSISINILRKQTANGGYLLDMILDKAGNKGTGAWSSKAALELGCDTTMMTAAVFARYSSAYKKKRVRLAQSISPVLSTSSTPTIDVNVLKKTYHFARLLNHQQGFALLKQAAETYNWQLDLPQTARIWTNGCIIRSTLMEQMVALFQKKNDLFADNSILKQLEESEESVIQFLTNGLQYGVALPVFSAAHQYWLSSTTERLSANLLQAQRDYFGAHTYQRIDAPDDQFFHTDWE